MSGGKGFLEIDCEKEFLAFKVAFDNQLILESKVVLGSSKQ
jgi:hypothetical protein